MEIRIDHENGMVKVILVGKFGDETVKWMEPGEAESIAAQIKAAAEIARDY
jgi:hypothetical protein